jgi:hypothetical protein
MISELRRKTLFVTLLAGAALLTSQVAFSRNWIPPELKTAAGSATAVLYVGMIAMNVHCFNVERNTRPSVQ